jgi:hypothetical protein
VQRAAVKALHSPQRRAPVEPGGAEGIGIGEPLQHADRRAAPEPHRADAGVAGAAGRHDVPGGLLGEAIDEAQTKSDGTARGVRRCQTLRL